MLKNLFTRHPEAIILFCMGLLILWLDIRPMAQCYAGTPEGARYPAIRGHPGDYYQYIYMIQQGLDGHITFHDAYTNEDVPDIVFQPLFQIIGLVFRILPFDAVMVYHIVRISSVITLWLSVLILIRRVIMKPISRAMAMLLYFSSSGFWSPQSFTPFTFTNLGLPYYPFPVFIRFHVLPPHHTLIIACIIILCLVYVKKQWSRLHSLIVVALTICVGFLNPHILYPYVLILGADFLLGLLLSPQNKIEHLKRFSLVVAASIPVFLYHMVIVATVLKSYTPSALLLAANTIPFQSYLLSLGPLTIITLPALFLIKWKSHLERVLILWALLPIALFFLPNLHIPISVYRMFEIQQFIPMAIMSALGISLLFVRTRLHLVAPVVIATIFFFYGIVPYVRDSYDYAAEMKMPGNCFTMPKPLVNMFGFIRQSTPVNAVVLADGSLAALLPTFTHARVLVGHEFYNTAKYAENSAWVQSFYANALTTEQADTFLKTNRITYAVFGFTTPIFKESAYADLFDPVFSEGTLTVAKVK